ncbi:MAG: bifunctional serine/threonine-protein kinase/formylglycine-generating enzyme family protein, partial [Polyangiaceae bacterium]
RALAKAHVLGIIHRDIKPENIFLLEVNEETSGMEEQQVKVLDFGIAKHVEVPESLTVPGMVIGTPGYMCPDQILDSKEVDQAADLWSLAVVAYVCLTGELPFYGETMAKLVGAHVKGEFTPVSAVRTDVPETVDDFFCRAFDKNRDERFNTAVELATAFRDVCGLPSGRGTQPDDLSIGAPRKRAMSKEDIRVSRPSLGDIRSPFSSDGDDVTASPVLTVPKRSRKLTGLAVAGIGLAAGIAIVLTVDTMSSSEGTPASPSATVTAPESDVRLPATGPWATIPAGKVVIGCDTAGRTDCDEHTTPAREVTLDSFRVGRREVTVAEYRRCVEEEACTAAGLTDDAVACSWGAASADNNPLNCVSWEQADAYCRWAGGALPTEAQWEAAARGDDDRRYPWGDDDPICSHAVMKDDQGAGCGRNNPWQVGSRPQGNGPHGTVDMAGNLREWTADWYAARLGPATPATGPSTGTERVIRGGGYQSDGLALRTYHREHLPPEARAADLGFRCARRTD